MNFRIADTFTDSLARLTSDEQKAVKTTAFDLQMNPASPGMSLHKLDRARDKKFWSVRVNSDIRLIVHKTDDSLLLCYVDHHDKAYAWAERRKLEIHPTTGAAQLVEIRETVVEIAIPHYIETSTSPPAKLRKPLLFQGVAETDILAYGVPSEWIPDVRAATEDTLFELAEHLPKEAAEALLELATGGKPQPPMRLPAESDPFAHPDAQRRFRVMQDIEELERALEFPWDKWTIFLHPAQRQLVERDYSGPARVTGSAGTGKTIVALHRAVFLAKTHPDARVLLTTFSETLANALQTRLRRLISNEPHLAERLEVHAIDTIGLRLYKAHFGAPRLASPDVILELIKNASTKAASHKFSLAFLLSEWQQVVDAWQLKSWESYRDVIRLGRKTRLPEPQRAVLWSIFERVRTDLAERELLTYPGMFEVLATTFHSGNMPPFDFAVVDEAQDLGVPHLRFLAALGARRPNGLFFAGDLGQRIFQQPFSWRALGVDIRGRSYTLRVNYRTSHQIRSQADRLLSATISDTDGNVEERGNAISVFNGPAPSILALDTIENEIAAVSRWLTSHITGGIAPHEIGIFVRSPAQVDRARAAATKAAIPFTMLDDTVATAGNHLSIGTMHLAKGLEFRAVAVMACDDEVIPLQERIQSVTDDADLQEVYETERHLLYVACTRARDDLLVTGVEPVSEFLDDFRMSAE